ncbi:HAD family hydrolase [Kitasatospora sp. LaBMicrA B282]|uniref:HAD family hydrolase n=1 Tax=Kitasatospora sp. LaBMicrA B282 TaxID=3420949 RepID=UPI003D0F4FA5
MADPRPVLLIDAGGTLLTRTRPGLTTRVVQAVRQAQGLTAEAESRLRAAVLTAADAQACLRALDLPPATAALVAEVLAADPGEAVVLPGAAELLRSAVESGWRVVLASNAGPGTPELPEVLRRHLSAVVESRALGLVKEDPRFWTRLVETERVDPRLALVVGDQEDADRSAPAAAGLQSRLAAGSLAQLAADLRAAGPAPAQAFAVVAGDHEEWAGREIVVAPQLAELVVRVTRAKLRYSSGAAGGTAIVVKRRSGPPAVVAHQGELPALAWLLAGRERSPYTVPASLRALLAEKGLSLEVLSAADQRHALSMIYEARADSTVTERTADLVRFLEDRREHGVPS